MKHSIIFSAIMVAFLFAACSQNGDNLSVVSPSFEKSGVVEPPQTFPYDYLECFDAIRVANWYSSGDVNYLEFTAEKLRSEYIHFFAVIELENSGQILTDKMYFLPKSGNNVFRIYGVKSAEVKDIRLYGLDGTQHPDDINLPYEPETKFDVLKVDTWYVDFNNNIQVHASLWPVEMSELYAELFTKRGRCLVFLQKPSAQNFAIPDFGEYGVGDVNLYYLSEAGDFRNTY